jgi:hypothetical protein
MLVHPGMKPHNPDQNQGEGDRRAARLYNRDVRRFVADNKVEDAAREAKEYVEKEPRAAERDEAAARCGPHGYRSPRGARGTRASVDELIAKSRTVVDRVRPLVKRAAARVRRRLHLK